MTNTLLHQLIIQLSPSEREEAKKWLCSPLHNSRKDIEKLFLSLDEYLFYLKLEPTKELLYQKVYPQQAYSDQQFRLVCSYLFKSLEEWLSWREWHHQSLSKGALLLKAYRKLELEKHQHRQIDKQRKRLNKTSLRHHLFYESQFLLEQEIYLAESKVGRELTLNLQQQENALQTAFLLNKLRLACLSIAHQRVSGAEYELRMMDQVLAYAQQSPFAENASIALYLSAYKMYQNADDELAFKQFSQLLFEHLNKFPSHEGRDLVLLGINFCIRQINKQGEVYFKEALNLYKHGLEANLLLEGGWLSAFTFSNITIIALRLGAYEWIDSFLSQYKKQLHPNRRESIFALNAARLAYHQQEHRKALLYLHQFEDRDFIHQMSAKIIQLKIYYEAGDFNLLAAHIKNTRAFLRRVKHHSYHKQIYINIFSLTEQLMKLSQYDKEKREKLRQQISDTEPLTEKDWLLAQLKTGKK